MDQLLRRHPWLQPQPATMCLPSGGSGSNAGGSNTGGSNTGGSNTGGGSGSGCGSVATAVSHSHSQQPLPLEVAYDLWLYQSVKSTFESGLVGGWVGMPCVASHGCHGETGRSQRKHKRVHVACSLIIRVQLD